MSQLTTCGDCGRLYNTFVNSHCPACAAQEKLSDDDATDETEQDSDESTSGAPTPDEKRHSVQE